MAPLDFPSSPTNGQAYQGYIYNLANDTWDSSYAPRAATIPISSPNYVINGGFDIWQRGTSFAGPSTAYTADRWQAPRLGFATGHTITRQSSGLTGFQYCARVQRDSGNTNTANLFFGSTFETVTSLPLQGKTVTFSFYARAGANFSSASSNLFADVYTGTGTDQNGVAGGFTGGTATNAVFTLTTSWQRFSFNAVVPTAATQIAPKFSYLPVGTAGANDYFEVTGVQLEEGGAATDFRRNAPSIQAELAACQRYYYRSAASAANFFTAGIGNSSGSALFSFPLGVPMRTIPTSIDWSALSVDNGYNANYTITAVNFAVGIQGSQHVGINAVVASGLSAGVPYWLRLQLSANGYIGFNAEL
jgi:hypothetical protein